MTNGSCKTIWSQTCCPALETSSRNKRYASTSSAGAPLGSGSRARVEKYEILRENFINAAARSCCVHEMGRLTGRTFYLFKFLQTTVKRSPLCSTRDESSMKIPSSFLENRVSSKRVSPNLKFACKISNRFRALTCTVRGNRRSFRVCPKVEVTTRIKEVSPCSLYKVCSYFLDLLSGAFAKRKLTLPEIAWL